MQQPSVGRQVHYISTLNADGEIIDPWAATIVRVNEDGSVNLVALSPFNGMDFFLQGKEEADLDDPNPAQGCSGRWMWPPRVTPVHTPQGPVVS